MPRKSLDGKRALITGAASGIGRALAVELARRGTHLWLLDVCQPELRRTVDELRSFGVEVVGRRCDLSRSEEISATVGELRESWDGLDILANNAGVAYYGPMERMTEEQWQWLLAVNLFAPIQLTRELLPLLLERPGGHVLNVASIAGLVGGRRLVAYHTSKFALVGFGESLRIEYASRGLGVTTLCPGLVATSMLERVATAPNGRGPKRPPRWLCTTPERVARQGVRAIMANRGLVVVSPMARLLWYTKRFSPRLLEWISCFRRHRRNEKRPRLRVVLPPEAGSSANSSNGENVLALPEAVESRRPRRSVRQAA